MQRERDLAKCKPHPVQAWLFQRKWKKHIVKKVKYSKLRKKKKKLMLSFNFVTDLYMNVYTH